nr:hypothetical protein [Tanacetum cinerariifolium]
MIQIKEMMQDKDLKNSESKDKGSRSRSQSMNEQGHYKQEKTETRPKKAKLKRHIFNIGKYNNPPYKFKQIEKTVPVAEGSYETTIEGYMENYKNILQDIRDQLNAEAEEFIKFTSRYGESYYLRFYKMMNELVRNQCDVTNHQVNVQFLLQLQLEWQRNWKHIICTWHIQEVTSDAADNSGPIFDAEPSQQLQNNDLNSNVFAIDHAHLEQPKSVNDIYLDEQGDTNITIDSLDMCYDRDQDDHDDTNELAQERNLLASLIKN